MLIGMCGMQWSQTEVSSSLSSFAFRDEEAESTASEVIIIIIP